jgi:hypothetical protein
MVEGFLTKNIMKLLLLFILSITTAHADVRWIGKGKCKVQLITEKRHDILGGLATTHRFGKLQCTK